MYHIVLLPQYRKRLLVGAIAKRIEESIQECADFNRWHINKIDIHPDHVRIFISLDPTIAVSTVIQLIKSKSNFSIREEFPELTEFLWGTHFWAEGFFVETIGRFSKNAIKEYVTNQ